MQIVKWNYCVDYKMVNPNVCASVLVSDVLNLIYFSPTKIAIQDIAYLML